MAVNVIRKFCSHNCINSIILTFLAPRSLHQNFTILHFCFCASIIESITTIFAIVGYRLQGEMLPIRSLGQSGSLPHIAMHCHTGAAGGGVGGNECGFSGKTCTGCPKEWGMFVKACGSCNFWYQKRSGPYVCTWKV